MMTHYNYPIVLAKTKPNIKLKIEIKPIISKVKPRI